MLKLPRDYYHCFLGNGLDAVLIGPTGSMVADKVGVDRCVWYKSDRYYPEDRLVKVAGRFPIEQPLEHAAGSGWYEVAPLGRTWYEVLWESQPLPLQASEQRFVPQAGTLYSRVDYGPVRAEVETFLHATRSVLVEHYVFDQEVEFRAWMGPGVWVEEGWDTDPFRAVEVAPPGETAVAHYDVGETQGVMALRLAAPVSGCGGQGRDRWLSARGRVFTKYFGIYDNRQGPVDTAFLEQAVAAGYERLRDEHLAFWRAYFARSSTRIPDAQFQHFYDSSLYHFKAMQNPQSGGLPVNNLRRTWSSHVFWDAYYLHRALLEANRRAEALEGIRFFQRTLDHAERHAREEFGCPGLKWDWEITHDGRKAYGVLLHMKDQVHNNASYANMIWQYYELTRDLAVLREFYPILAGLAQFFLACIVEETARGLETRPVVGVDERPVRVRNEGITLAGTIAILQHTARAAQLLGCEDEVTARCTATAERLTHTLGWLYNGEYFAAAEGSTKLNMSSLAPMYPMQIVGVEDERARSTVARYLAAYAGRMAGHGGSEHGFPWSAGVLATILGRMGDSERAWNAIESTRPSLCMHGGMTEVMENGEWNMQYFGTAQAAVCTALHNLMLQARGDEVRLWPARPEHWQDAAFEGLLAAGVEVTASYGAGRVHWRVKNSAPVERALTIRYGTQASTLVLRAGMEAYDEWPA